ncbi:CLUMA_CG001773, isoform A [Clunio marinus]|uniref:CLUMA_CG001773, isoform A n=1 Tax=Clunio marinus TaxID=568069 RepID=A0A1J1HJ95_9DIPT|nr:CLUMA_CG001773, isoform A [Clunio marinus]
MEDCSRKKGLSFIEKCNKVNDFLPTLGNLALKQKRKLKLKLKRVFESENKSLRSMEILLMKQKLKQLLNRIEQF